MLFKLPLPLSHIHIRSSLSLQPQRWSVSLRAGVPLHQSRRLSQNRCLRLVTLVDSWPRETATAHTFVKKLRLTWKPKFRPNLHAGNYITPLRVVQFLVQNANCTWNMRAWNATKNAALMTWPPTSSSSTRTELSSATLVASNAMTSRLICNDICMKTIMIQSPRSDRKSVV